MPKLNLVHTNKHDVNVLVQTTNSNNRHHYHLNKSVKIEKVLSDKDLIKLYKDAEYPNLLQNAKDWAKKQKGYAISNVEDKIANINCSSIVKFKNNESA